MSQPIVAGSLVYRVSSRHLERVFRLLNFTRGDTSVDVDATICAVLMAGLLALISYGWRLRGGRHEWDDEELSDGKDGDIDRP
jgi:hypothetical protein